jgi:hypothetical protein
MWLLMLQAAPTLESLKAISVASQLMGDLTGATLDDPLADRYAKLGCQITPLDHDGEDFKMILNYLSKTIEPIEFNDTVCLYFLDCWRSFNFKSSFRSHRLLSAD